MRDLRLLDPHPRGSPLLADVIREMGSRKDKDFYIALGQAKISPKTVTSKLMHRLKEGEAAVEPASAATELLERKGDPEEDGGLVELRHHAAADPVSEASRPARAGDGAGG